MYYIVETNRSFNQALTDLEAAVTHHGFGVLHVHDLGTTLRSKGIAFAEECNVFEVCNPGQATKVFVHRYAPEHGITVSYLGVYRERKNQDRSYQASADAFSAIPGCSVS